MIREKRINLTEEELSKKFPEIDENGDRYKTKPSAWRQPSMGARPNLCYAFQGIMPPYPSGWRFDSDRMEEEYQKGNILIVKGKLERRTFAKNHVGPSPGNLWTEAEFVLSANSPERYGYPTQKPTTLYERIIKASSNEGDMVLDPFAGCATTCVAAERLGRQWVGIDIWEKAHNAVVDRLREQAGLLGDVHYISDPPTRTDDGETVAPFLRVKERVKEPEGPRWTRAQMYEHLLNQHGSRCVGCDRTFDDSRYLELDHNTPRADGGWNHISNRILLCGPCNRAKSNIYTLSGLRRLNKRNDWMAK